ncbi:MAG TPA: hypothetical protein VNN20_06445 [Thermodesulfobacteriota bacterium]|nr:hypothetical protein [Thermodesulfobacteriota bacterium]
MKKLLALTYPQGSLIIEGKKGEVSLVAQISSRSASVVIRDWAIVDMLGALKLAFLGLLPRNHTIKGEGGYIVICQTDKKGELQTSIRIGKDWEEERIAFFLSPIENHRIQRLLEMCLD